MSGDNGLDLVDGGPGDDRLSGDHGADEIRGGAGDDELSGDVSDDANDLLYGGPGDDVIDGAQGRDLSVGGPGHDAIRSADGVPERVRCGPGDDQALADRGDLLEQCERVERVRSAYPTVSPRAGHGKTRFRLGFFVPSIYEGGRVVVIGPRRGCGADAYFTTDLYAQYVRVTPRPQGKSRRWCPGAYRITVLGHVNEGEDSYDDVLGHAYFTVR